MRIKQLLAEKGVTAKALALSTGLTEMGLSKIITGKSSPFHAVPSSMITLTMKVQSIIRPSALIVANHYL